MRTAFLYKRGDLLADVQLGGLPYRVERLLVDHDTDVGLYVIRRVDDNTELLRNAKPIDNLECYERLEHGVAG